MEKAKKMAEEHPNAAMCFYFNRISRYSVGEGAQASEGNIPAILIAVVAQPGPVCFTVGTDKPSVTEAESMRFIGIFDALRAGAADLLKSDAPETVVSGALETVQIIYDAISAGGGKSTILARGDAQRETAN